MREISKYKTLAQKYNLVNRADCINRINDLYDTESELIYMVKEYRERNDMELADKYEAELIKISKHINNLSMLLGRDAEIRTKYMEKLDKANYEKTKASFAAKFAYEEGKYDIQRKFLNDLDNANKQKEEIEAKISDDKMYFEEEEEKQEEKKRRNKSCKKRCKKEEW